MEKLEFKIVKVYKMAAIRNYAAGKMRLIFIRDVGGVKNQRPNFTKSKKYTFINNSLQTIIFLLVFIVNLNYITYYANLKYIFQI